METATPNETDTTIRNMMQNRDPENIIFPADLRDIRKPKSYNKRKETNKKSASGYKEPTRIQKQIENKTDNLEPTAEEYTAPSQIQPEEIDKQTNEQNRRDATHPQVPAFEEIRMPQRRSTRIPKLSAKALENLQYD